MAESSGFFDAEELVDGGYDREYVAEQWANYFKLFIGNGVFANPANTLKVIAGSGLTVKVLPGWAWINGYWYHNDSELTLEIPTNLTLSTIKDGIFLRFDSANRVISALVGVNRTTVNRVSPYYELKLAEVTVDVGVTSISDADITDTRTDSSVCGIVAGVIDQIDTTDLFAQYQAAFNAFMQGSGTEFEEWFDHMKDQLDTDAAGHLQAEVDEINEIIAPVQLTLTASQPYAIGEQFIYEGKLYTATSAIAQNDTIIIDTNASLSDEIVKQIDLAKFKQVRRNTTYSVNDFVLCQSASDSLIFVCTTAGTTAIQEPTAYATVTDENTVTDGTAVFKAVSVSEQIIKLSKAEVLIINVASFSSLPQTIPNPLVESDMVVVNSVLGTPSAQTGDWTVATANGSLTISGTNAISGSTTLTLYLSKSR